MTGNKTVKTAQMKKAVREVMICSIKNNTSPFIYFSAIFVDYCIQKYFERYFSRAVSFSTFFLIACLSVLQIFVKSQHLRAIMANVSQNRTLCVMDKMTVATTRMNLAVVGGIYFLCSSPHILHCLILI